MMIKDVVTIVDMNGATPYSYIDPAVFTFTGCNRCSARTMDSGISIIK